MIKNAKYLDVMDKDMPPLFYHFLWAYYKGGDLIQGNDMIYSLSLDLNDWDELKPEEDEDMDDDYNPWEAIRSEYKARTANPNSYCGGGSKKPFTETLEEAFEKFKEWTKSQGVEFAHGSDEILLVKMWW